MPTYENRFPLAHNLSSKSAEIRLLFQCQCYIELLFTAHIGYLIREVKFIPLGVEEGGEVVKGRGGRVSPS